MAQPVWVGVDAGKAEHYCVVIDSEGHRLLSRRVANDEAALLDLISTVMPLADDGEITWAIDLNAGGAALLITLLIAAEQRLLYIPGRTVYHAAGSYRGDGKTDAKDAAIIADQARMRRDLQPLCAGDDITVELRILTSRRTDLVADRTRAINRLRAQLIEERFRRHRHAEIILSMPGFGVTLGAEFIAATGGDMSAFASADRLAGDAGLAPVPRDSGRISGNMKRPRRYNRRLLRTCYLSALVSIRADPASRAYYDRKRAEGKRHTQAVLALARRRLNVLWAMLRDGTLYQPNGPTAAAA